MEKDGDSIIEIGDSSQNSFFNFSFYFQNFFFDLKRDLIRAGINTPFQKYLFLMFVSTFISLFLGILIGVLFFIFLKNLFLSIFIFLFLPLITFFSFYIYPSLEIKSLEKRINEELPFVVIYMSAIASSEIEPTRMFFLASESKEYPVVAKEIKKVLTQITMYGYDLVTALKNSAQNCGNEKLAEFFSGLAINLVGGGSLKNYLNKKAENYLIEYRLERQKYKELAETFMNIYISLLIVAPLILMITLVIMMSGGFNIPIEPSTLNLLVFSLIILFNFFFLIFLELKRPKE